MKYRVLVFFIVCLCLSSTVKAQEEDVDFQTWVDFTGYRFVSDKSAVGGDAGIRGLFSSRVWTQFYIRPTYRYQFNSLDLSGGFALFYTYNSDISNVTEWRLFQQATVHWPSTNILKFNHRIRLEQRWFNYSDERDNEFYARIRYQLTMRSRDFSIYNQKLYFKVSAEAFQRNNSGDEAFVNTSRFTFVVGHRPKGRFWYEVQYIAQKSRQFEEDGFKTSEHILRFRLFRADIFKHRID